MKVTVGFFLIGMYGALITGVVSWRVSERQQKTITMTVGDVSKRTEWSGASHTRAELIWFWIGTTAGIVGLTVVMVREIIL